MSGSEEEQERRRAPTDRLPAQEMKPALIPRRILKAQTRRDFILYGIGAALVAAGFWWLLPQETQQQLGDRNPRFSRRKQAVLNAALNLDDDVAELLYSPTRTAPTYPASEALAPAVFPVNYEEGSPDQLYGNYVPHWQLTVSGLASGKTEILKMPDIDALIARYGRQEQVTRLVCVEGWSVVGQWSGLLFSHFMEAFPPMPGAKWAEMRADFNVGQDEMGNYIPDPYYVSLDLATLHNPQSLLATEQSGQPLDIGHGAPLRLRLPMKLGLKNIKAITRITYTIEQPKDYWSAFRDTPNARGYSRYDGL
jgi:DMSO/TMAO reductase YedYZ molybdopterin-dependent catalytic subunit